MASEYGYEKAMKRELERESAAEIAKRAAAVGLSGGLSGAVMGAGASLLTSGSPLAGLKAMGAGAGTGALVAGGANLLGSLLAPSSDNDPTINTRRGGLGGALVGGIGGTALGAMNRIPGVAPASMLGKVQSALARSKYGRLLGAGLGAVGGSAFGAAVGSDEGMQYDAITNEARRRGIEL